MVLTAELLIFGVIVLFFAFLLMKKIRGRRFCVVCASVSGVWIIALTLSYVGITVDPLMLGILMGGSAVGIYYLIERKTPEKMHIFRLPFLLTLVVLAYILITRSWFGMMGIIALASLWSFFGVVYVVRANPRIKKFAQALIECCKNW